MIKNLIICHSKMYGIKHLTKQKEYHKGYKVFSNNNQLRNKITLFQIIIINKSIGMNKFMLTVIRGTSSKAFMNISSSAPPALAAKSNKNKFIF